MAVPHAQPMPPPNHTRPLDLHLASLSLSPVDETSQLSPSPSTGCPRDIAYIHNIHTYISSYSTLHLLLIHIRSSEFAFDHRFIRLERYRHSSKRPSILTSISCRDCCRTTDTPSRVPTSSETSLDATSIHQLDPRPAPGSKTPKVHPPAGLSRVVLVVCID